MDERVVQPPLLVGQDDEVGSTDPLAGRVQEQLVAAGDGRAERHAHRLFAPIERRRHGAFVRGEPDGEDVAIVPFAQELPEAGAAKLAELRRARVARVREVRPDDDLAEAPEPVVQVLDDRREHVGHVTVAQVPRDDRIHEHAPVVLLGVAHEPRVRVDLERGLERRCVDPGALAMASLRGGEIALHLEDLLCDRVLARGLLARGGGERVRARVRSEWIEARVARSRAPRRFGIALLEAAEHGVDRCVDAVEIQAANADVRSRPPGPVDEIAHDGVLAEPPRETREARERLLGPEVGASPSDEALHAVRLRPAFFDRDRVETFFGDEPPCDARADERKLVRAVRRRPEQHEARASDALEQPCTSVLERDRGPRQIELLGAHIMLQLRATHVPQPARDAPLQRG